MTEEFCLRWNNHGSNLTCAFYDLRLGEDFVDVTLACEGQSLQAHKVVLSACSPFFRDILKTTPCKHPVIVLKDILYNDLVSLIEFIYMGEVRVKHQGLPSFLSTAEMLKVRGLTEPSSKQKTSFLAAASENASSTKIPNPIHPCPSFSSVQLAEGDATIQHQPEATLQQSPAMPSASNNGFNNAAGSTSSVGMPAGIKVEEEVDLDSASDDEEDDEMTGRPNRARIADQGLPDTGMEDSHEDGFSAPPSLTLQSFARIPALGALESHPIYNHHETDLPSISNERRVSLDIPAMESENVAGRTPGRMSSSDRPRWPCPFCMRLLSSRSSVRRHIEDRHTNDTSRHPCPLCERLYRTRNSLQYHLSTAHRDREPGPRGRPRIRPRTPSTTESSVLAVVDPSNKNNPAAELEGGSRHNNLSVTVSNTAYNLNRGPPYGLPPT